LNIYAGLAGFFLVRDQRERFLNLPSGPFDIPLMIQDRSFNKDGSLHYPNLGSTEIWYLINLTDDAHPIHIHLIDFQVLDRRPFDVEQYKKTNVLQYTGPSIDPEAQERGWKDTVRANPRQVTRIIMKFGPYTGLYVWHCHILEHEDYEMMRPFIVIR
jgi:spore coat protein A, manganese oxidase